MNEQTEKRQPKEIWKTLPINTKYQISNYGNCRLKKNKSPLKWHVNNKGYYLLAIRHTIEGKTREWLLVHHAVLISFRTKDGRPEGMQTDHLDGDKANNYIGNLAWVTHQENIRRAVAAGKFHFPNRKPTQNKPVICTVTETEVTIKDFSSEIESTTTNKVQYLYKSIAEATRQTGISRKTILSRINNPSKRSKKGNWEFAAN